MACARREHLQQRHDSVRATFDAVRKRLRERIGRCPRAEFLALSDDLDRAGEALDFARAALDNHILHHCCLTHDNTLPE